MTSSKNEQFSKADRVLMAGMPFDLLTLETVDDLLASRSSDAPFEYVVTPNVDHVVKNHQQGNRHLYEEAWISVCDSRILAKLGKLVSIHFPDVITGSDLTRRILDSFLKPSDHITVIGTDARYIEQLRVRFPGVVVHHYNPPMGFIKDAEEVERTVDFVVSHPSRFVFLAVGAPQQEKLALSIRRKGTAKGIGLCIGASILFVVGAEKRAPEWVQRLHMEWLFRLLQDPKRLWKRYLVDDPLVFWLVVRQRLRNSK